MAKERTMAKRKRARLFVSLLRERIPITSEALWFLLRASLFLVVAYAASAQTSTQQYVYLSLPGLPPAAPSSLLSGFSKAGQTGALNPVPASPFNDRLEGGLVAIDGQGKFLFVLNSTTNDISMFQIDQASGALSEVAGSPFAVPATGPNAAPSQPLSITAESSGRFLFVGYFNGGLPGDSAIASLAINLSGSTPILVPIESLDILGAPLQLLTDPKGQHLYVGLSQGPNGAVNGGAIVFNIDLSTGMLLKQGTADTLLNNGSSYAIDPRDRFFYGSGKDFLQSCLISPVDGTANTCSPLLLLDPNNTQIAMVAENSGQFLYLYQSGAAPGVVVYSVNQTTGALTPVLGPLSGIQFANGGTVADPMGPYIYSAKFATPTVIHAYQVGQQTGNLTEISGSPFNSGSAGNCCGGLAISGTPSQAVSGPAVSIFPSTANFSAVVGSTSPTQIFSIVNTGNQLLALNSISITGTNASSFSQTNTCQATLAPNANCSVSITFSPASVGPSIANLQVADNAPGTPQTLVLNGTGIAPVPAATFSPAVPSFPTTTQGTSSPAQTLTITNSGNAPLIVSSVSLSGPNSSDFSFTNNCSAPVAPGSSCAVSLVFNPIGPGQRTATLLVSDNVQGSPQTISLSAAANPAFSAAAAPGSSNTASVSAGQPAQYQLQLTPGAGFSGTVGLGCTGAPLGAVCQVPANVSLANGTATTFTVTVTTSGPALVPPLTPVRLPHMPPPAPVPLLLTFLISLFAFLAKNHRSFERAASWNRLALSGALSAALFCVTLSFSGCGGGSAAVTPPPLPIITPSGTSTITISLSATSSSGEPLQLQPIQLTLTVK